MCPRIFFVNASVFWFFKLGFPPKNTCWYNQTWVNDHLLTATTILESQFMFLQHKPVPLCTTTTCQQRPQILSPEGGRCTQVWLYLKHSVSVSSFHTQRESTFVTQRWNFRVIFRFEDSEWWVSALFQIRMSESWGSREGKRKMNEREWHLFE
jgi:hypothetical protein